MSKKNVIIGVVAGGASAAAKSLAGGYSTYLARTSEKLLEGKTGQQLRDEFCTGF